MNTAAQSETPTTPYELIGGEAALRKLVDRFYELMDRDPDFAELRALHAADLGPMRQKLFEFLSGWTGGPRAYQGCVVSAHIPFKIGARERDQWLACIRRAMDETGVSPEIRDMYLVPLTRMADMLTNA